MGQVALFLATSNVRTSSWLMDVTNSTNSTSGSWSNSGTYKRANSKLQNMTGNLSWWCFYPSLPGLWPLIGSQGARAVLLSSYNPRQGGEQSSTKAFLPKKSRNVKSPLTENIIPGHLFPGCLDFQLNHSFRGPGCWDHAMVVILLLDLDMGWWGIPMLIGAWGDVRIPRFFGIRLYLICLHIVCASAGSCPCVHTRA